MIALDDLLALGGRLHGPRRAAAFADVSYDSRLTRPGELFVALRTPRADGHDFVPDALLAGAAGLLCARPPADPAGATVVLADEPLALLTAWAARRLTALGPLVAGVAGSVGKTTTRRALAAVLGAAAPTFQSRRSFNTPLGLAVSLARLAPEHRFAVLELGSDHPGELARLAALFPPRLAVVTAVGETHLRAFGSLAGVAAELAALVAALPPDGVAVLNGDDPHVAALAAHTRARVVTFGRGAGCDLRAAAVAFEAGAVVADLAWRGRSAGARIPLVGEPGLYAGLAACAAGLALGLELGACAAALAAVTPAAGRLRPLPAVGGARLLDDSFDASPPAVRAALGALAAAPARRRIAVLGDLADLPDDDGPIYAELGRLAARAADLVICKGDRAARAAAAAPGARVVHTAAAAAEALAAELGPGDLVLLSGGAGARLERVAARLLAPGLVAAEHLARQEAAWRSVRIGDPGRPTRLLVDLDALAHNVRRLGAIAGVPLMAVLKADAYGHGAIRVARTALAAGARALAVATLGEARALREAGVAAPVLVLGYTPPWQAREAVLLGVTCTVFDDDGAGALAAAAADLGRPAVVHVKVDTGMARLGLAPAEAPAFLARLRGLPGLEVEGVYTHFATADGPDEAFARTQLGRFTALLGELAAGGLRPPVAHAANSAATLRLPEARLDMVRPGLALYGLAPSPAVPLPADMAPALSFHTEVAQVKAHPAGTPISYGGAFVTARPSLIATIPAGYADGLRRSPPWRAALVRGRRAPVVGRICMDYAMLDVTDIPGVRRGDAVVLIGAQGAEAISADEAAGWLGTISYEVLAGILPRVPREVGE